MSEDTRLERIESLLKQMNDTMVAHITMEEALRPSLVELIDLLAQSKGILRFLRVVIFLIAPVIAALVWIKDHVKL